MINKKDHYHDEDENNQYLSKYSKIDDIILCFDRILSVRYNLKKSTDSKITNFHWKLFLFLRLNLNSYRYFSTISLNHDYFLNYMSFDYEIL